MGLHLLVCGWWASAWADMPVKSIDYDVKVEGPLAEMRIEQVFVNDSDEVIEAIYVFPLHEEAAVDGMRMTVGSRVIEGEILEVQRALDEYDEALEEGHTAALTTQQRPNVFTQQVGNIAPGEEVRVELRVVQPVPHVDGKYELVLPLVVAPRFVSPQEWAVTFEEDHPFEGPPVAQGGTPLAAGIDVEVDSGLPFEFMLSPSHEIALAEIAGGARAVTGRVPLDKDFVLQWSVSADRPLATLHVQDSHVLVTLEPPETPPRRTIVPREFIWVIDQSCSMSGEPIALVRKAMFAALDYVDERDSIRILRFSDKVVGDAYSKPATPQVLWKARMDILQLDTSGGTYLLDGVLAALDTPPDPSRERTIIFLTDALIGEDRAVLRTIADRVGKARLFAFGVGPTANRWLLDEMARVGGGRTSWLRMGEEPEDAVERFADTLAKPVLSDIQVDWGDWEVEETWPRRIPALYAGQPLTLVSRIVKRGTTDVVVRGRLGDGAYQQVLSPIDVPMGRAIPSTWARQKIANLERDLVWGHIPEIEDEILETSLTYQVLSRLTAFLAVDRSRVVSPGGPERIQRQPVDSPAGTEVFYGGTGSAQEVLVVAKTPTIDTQSVSIGQVLTKDYLQKIPAGRTYQSALQSVPGVSGAVGGNPKMGGGSYDENTYMLDGANITDPVTGTFSINFNYDAIQQIEVLTAGRMPEIAGATGPVVNLVTRSGTNNLETSLRLDRTTGLHSGAPLEAERATGLLSGPLIRDRLWVLGSYGFDRSLLDGEDPRRFLGHTGFLKMTLQPSVEHRFSASGAGESSSVDALGALVRQQTVLGNARWQWFLAPEANTDTAVDVQEQRVAGDLRQRMAARTNLSLLSVEDPLGGRHDFKGGADFERTSWTLAGDWTSQWLGVEVPLQATVARGGFFLQDSYKPVSNLTLNGGARLDLAMGRTYVGPRLYGAWDPFGDQKTKLAVGLGRLYGNVGLATSVIAPEAGLTRLDEGLAVLERQIVQDLALGGEATVRNRYDLPLYGGGRGDQSTWSTRLYLRKVEARRWAADLSWRYSQLLFPAPGDAPLLWIDDGSLAAFTHVLDGQAYWDLPTDPFTLSLGVLGSYFDEPLTPVTADPLLGTLPGLPRWTAGVRLAQTIDLRKGHLLLDAELRYLALLDEGVDLPAVNWVQTPLLDREGWGGPRLQLGVSYEF